MVILGSIIKIPTSSGDIIGCFLLWLFLFSDSLEARLPGESLLETLGYQGEWVQLEACGGGSGEPLH